MPSVTSISPQQAWLIGLLSMLAVFLWFSRSYGLRSAFILSLVWGKILAGVYYILHIDIVIAQVYWYNPERHTLRELFTLTANELIFAMFLATTLTVLAWPGLERELGIRVDLLSRVGRRAR